MQEQKPDDEVVAAAIPNVADEDCEEFCSSDVLDDRVGLPSGVISPEAEYRDRHLLADREEIECGCSVEDECSDCVDDPELLRHGH